MLLIEDDTLVHVDSASDVLEHYGRNRNNDISAINNKAEYKLNGAKDRNRFVRNAAGVAVTAGSLYLSTPSGQRTANEVASRVSDAIRYRSLNVRRRR